MTVSGFAQTDRGTVRGIVTDSRGGVIRNASVQVTNEASGETFKAATNGSGVYNITALLPGQYDLTVASQGFQTFVQKTIAVNLGDIANVDVHLPVGMATQEVTVTDAAPILKSEQSDTSTEVNVNAYNELPLSAAGGRSPLTFGSLVPGVQGLSVNGGPQYGLDIQLDGASTVNGELFGDNRQVALPPDSVQQLSFTTSAYSAEYGQTGDGVERLEIRSGTNEYHGTVYEFFKNTILDAAGYFNKTTPVDHQNEYGFTLGGPVSIPHLYNGKNRSFFFVNGDWFRIKTGGGIAAGQSVPTDAMLNGDFSALLPSGIVIYDPSTTKAVGNGYTRQPFKGNIIPKSDFSSIGVKFLSYYRSALPPGTVINQSLFLNNASIPETTKTSHKNLFIMKMDQIIGSSHHVSVSLQHSVNPFINSSPLEDPVGNAIPTRNLHELARVAYDWTISPNKLNQFRFSYNRDNGGSHDPDYNTGLLPGLGLQGYSTASDFFPTLTAGSYLGFAATHNINVQTSNTYILSDAFSWTLGRHSLKLGTEIRDYRHGVVREVPATLAFNRNETASPTALNTTGNEIASILLGQVASSTIPNYENISPNYYWKTVDAYVQDDWKVTSKLTLNLGVRYSFMTPMQERHNLYSVFDPTASNPTTGLPGSYVFATINGQGNRLSFAKNDLNYFAPRLGFAYKLFENTVLSGGYGVSYFPDGAFGTGNNTFLVDGYVPTSSVSSPNNGISPAFQLDQGFPQANIQTAQLNSKYGINGSFNYWAPQADRASSIQSYNLTVQQAFGKNWVTTISYVGTTGTNLVVAGNINQVDPKYASLGNVLLGKSINDPAVIAAGFRAPYPGFASQLGANATLAQSLRPFPAYLNGSAYSSDTRGHSTYSSLQLKATRRFSDGFYVLAAFTWDQSLANAGATWTGAEAGVIDEYNLDRDYTQTSTFVPITQTTAFTYELPFGRNKRFFGGAGRGAQALIGGWGVNGILTYHSGGLIAVGAGDNLGISAGSQFAYLNGSVSPRLPFNGHAGATGSKYLNAAAFTQLPSTTTMFSPGKRNVPGVLGPFYADEDLSVVKQIPFTERYRSEFRLEAFNAFNRVIFGLPNTTLTNPAFGTITSQANAARVAQIVFKLTF